VGRLQAGADVVARLADDLKYERETQRPLLVESIALCEQLQDYVSRDLLEDLLERCEENIDWLETQQRLIEDVTLPNYLQAHME
jgi:bacterioferritin